jgi:protein-S-isoprenylcysteine O-methyltransferase Ste14
MANLVPIFGIIFGCGIALLAIWAGYRRDRALIEKGLYQPEKSETAGPLGWGFLVAGSIVAGIGIALIVSAFVFQIGKAIGVPGFIFLFIGIALLIVYFIAKEKKDNTQGLKEEELATS